MRVTGETVQYPQANGDAVPSQARPSASARPDVFMWAVLDWHFRTQRPQHLPRALMEAGHRVFYLSNNLVDDSQPGFNLEQLDDGGRLFQFSLTAPGAPAFYYGLPSADTVPHLRPTFGFLILLFSDDRLVGYT